LIVDRVAFDLRGLIGMLKQAYGALADTKGLTLYVDIDEDVPQHVLGDPMRLRQVLTNYLTNALKFTTTGSILLNVQRGVGYRLRFEVIDTGAGMDARAWRCCSCRSARSTTRSPARSAAPAWPVRSAASSRA